MMFSKIPDLHRFERLVFRKKKTSWGCSLKFSRNLLKARQAGVLYAAPITRANGFCRRGSGTGGVVHLMTGPGAVRPEPQMDRPDPAALVRYLSQSGCTKQTPTAKKCRPAG